MFCLFFSFNLHATSSKSSKFQEKSFERANPSKKIFFFKIYLHSNSLNQQYNTYTHSRFNKLLKKKHHLHYRLGLWSCLKQIWQNHALTRSLIWLYLSISSFNWFYGLDFLKLRKKNESKKLQ